MSERERGIKMIQLVVRVARHGGRGRRRVRQVPGSRSRGRPRSSLDLRLLIDGEEITLFLEPNAVGAAILRVVWREETADLPPSTMSYRTTTLSRSRVRSGEGYIPQATDVL